MSSKLEDRSDSLQKLMADTESDIDSYEKLTSEKNKSLNKYFSKTVIAAILTPIIIYILLYFIQPSFVESEDDSGSVEKDNRKVILWTIGVSVVVWICIYLFKFCKNKKSN